MNCIRPFMHLGLLVHISLVGSCLLPTEVEAVPDRKAPPAESGIVEITVSAQWVAFDESTIPYSGVLVNVIHTERDKANRIGYTRLLLEKVRLLRFEFREDEWAMTVAVCSEDAQKLAAVQQTGVLTFCMPDPEAQVLTKDRLLDLNRKKITIE